MSKILLELRRASATGQGIKAMAEKDGILRTVRVDGKTTFPVYKKLSKSQRRALRQSGKCRIDALRFIEILRKREM